jgi:hypothetical protein
MNIAIEGPPFAAKYKFFVIPNEQREDDCMGKGCSCNPVAFPPSMAVMQEVRCHGRER